MGSRGFTLVELMVAIAVLAVLAAIAFPSFQGTIRSNRIATATNELLAGIALARAEAVRNPGGAGLCASLAGSACDGEWNDGWLVWIDVNGNGSLDDGERILRFAQTHPGLVITATSPGGADAAEAIPFDLRGRPSDTQTREITIAPENCPAGQELVRVLAMSLSGQIVSTREACP